MTFFGIIVLFHQVMETVVPFKGGTISMNSIRSDERKISSVKKSLDRIIWVPILGHLMLRHSVMSLLLLLLDRTGRAYIFFSGHLKDYSSYRWGHSRPLVVGYKMILKKRGARISPKMARSNPSLFSAIDTWMRDTRSSERVASYYYIMFFSPCDIS